MAKLTEIKKRLARYFVADPKHSAVAAAAKCKRGKSWASGVLREPEVIEYVRELAGGQDPAELMHRPGPAPISETKALAARQAELVAPGEDDIRRVFERLRTFMDFRLVDYLTEEDQPLALDAGKIRALKGTDAGRAIKKLKHTNFKTLDKNGIVTSERDTYEVEIESPLAATQAMAKVLGIERTDGDERGQRAAAALETVLSRLPPETASQIYLAMLEHSGSLLAMPTNGNGKPS